MTARKLTEILRAPQEYRQPLLENFLQAQPHLGPQVAANLMERFLQAEKAAEICQAQVAELKKLVDEVTAPPLLLGAVVAGEDGQYLVAVGGNRQQVKKDPGLKKPLACGDIVALSKEGNVIIQHLPHYRAPGKVGRVCGWHDGKLLVEHLSDQALALDPSPAVLATQPREGDKVLFHEQWLIALEMVERPSNPASDETAAVSLHDIGGLDDQIDELLLEVERGFLYPDKAEALELPPMKGFILVGAPGTGKTLLIKGLANWIRQQYGRRVLFRSIAPGSWRDPLFGMSERRMVEPFKEARRLLAERQVDLVILFYDEMDTLGTRSHEMTNRIDSRILDAFLAELDGLTGREGILVCGATNVIHLVDEALLRPDRFGDRIIRIPRPNREAARAIFRCHLRPSVKFWSNGEALPPARMVERCIDSALAMLFKETDPGDALVELTLANGQRRPVWGREVLSGAVIANIVRQGKKLAFRRSLTGPAGLVPEDLAQAAEQELSTIAGRLQDPGKVREILGDLGLPIARISPGRWGRPANAR